MHGMRPGTFRTNYPGDDIKHASIQYFHGSQFMAAALRAEREGADAFAISTLPEPALREARSLLNIPVVGYRASAMLTACMPGQRSGLLVFTAALAELDAATAVRPGLALRFAVSNSSRIRLHARLEVCEKPRHQIDRF